MSEHEEFVCVERQRDEAIRERDEARKDRDGWRASEQETSRDYHELRDLNTKVRSILRAPLDTTTDDAAAGVVYERDRLYAEIQKLTAERKDILEQRDEARQQRDEAQKLAVERGEQIEGLKHNLERADAEAERVWSRWEALAGRLRSIDRVLLIETHDAEATLQAVQKVVNEHRKAVIDLDYQRTEACKADQRASKLAEELERTKTLLAEDRAELRDLRDHDKKTTEELIHVRHDLSVSHSLVDELRSIVGAGFADATRDAARRVVAERDAAVSDLAEQRRREAEQNEARRWQVDEVRELLQAGPVESVVEAVRRVVAERNDALQRARDAKRALNPAELPPGLRWVWEGSDFDGSGRWEALYESLIVGRVERCNATSCTPAGWRWQRLDGTRDWGIEDDEHTGLVGLARHLRTHPPLAAVAPAEPEPELPPGLSWRHLGAFKSQVLKGDRVVGEFVCVGTNRWSWWMVYPKSPSVLSAAGHEEMSGYEARAALVAALRKAHGSSEQADAPASTEQQPSESADPLGLPPGLHWAQDKAPHGEWFVDAAKGRPLAWAGQTDDGWGWHLSSIGVCYGSAPTVVEERGLPSVDEARKRLAAHLRQRGPSSKG